MCLVTLTHDNNADVTNFQLPPPDAGDGPDTHRVKSNAWTTARQTHLALIAWPSSGVSHGSGHVVHAIAGMRNTWLCDSTCHAA